MSQFQIVFESRSRDSNLLLLLPPHLLAEPHLHPRPHLHAGPHLLVQVHLHAVPFVLRKFMKVQIPLIENDEYSNLVKRLKVHWQPCICV